MHGRSKAMEGVFPLYFPSYCSGRDVTTEACVPPLRGKQMQGLSIHNPLYFPKGDGRGGLYVHILANPQAPLKGRSFFLFIPWGWPAEGHDNFLLKRSFPPRPSSFPKGRKKGNPLGQNKGRKWNFRRKFIHDAVCSHPVPSGSRVECLEFKKIEEFL